VWHVEARDNNGGHQGECVLCLFRHPAFWGAWWNAVRLVSDWTLLGLGLRICVGGTCCVRVPRPPAVQIYLCLRTFGVFRSCWGALAIPRARRKDSLTCWHFVGTDDPQNFR
jgi:hypothetical protein